MVLILLVLNGTNQICAFIFIREYCLLWKNPTKFWKRSTTIKIAACKKPRIEDYVETMSGEDIVIDDSLYSRQRYVLGDSAMQRMARSNVLLSGLGGLGVEIAKNLVLAGIKSLTILDDKKARYSDLGTQFFLHESDVKSARLRSDASISSLAELNPYVTVKQCTGSLDENSGLDFLKEFQCVVMTEGSLKSQLRVDAFCRLHNIQFICGDVYGVFGSVFCDFGNDFEILDPNGEEPKEVFIATITKANPGVVTCLENRMHGFESGDTVTFKEIKGMDVLNGKQCQIKVVSPYAYSICDTTGPEFNPHTEGGKASQCKVPQKLSFKSLEDQLNDPNILLADLAKFQAPANIHLAMISLHKFQEDQNRLPNIRCEKDAGVMLNIVKTVNSKMATKMEQIDESLIRHLSYTAHGCFAPLCTALGGIVAQEALKALTGKFTPLNQWLHLDAIEVLDDLQAESTSFQPRENRYDALRMCIGEELCQKLSNLRLFMVGCGAIGCEMIKNYAMLGIGTSGKGLITITDNDLIEKSNLNRQFLFRPHHIQKAKSVTAAKSALDINPELHIDPHEHRVGPQTESTVYTDAFFTGQDMCVNALDNVEARKYMDSRCVTNQRALLESGTMGAKGHVQVIVPHLTESYSSQRDPPDEDVPYCTLKSFPATIEHCIQWARDKFESSFCQKPALFNKFWSSNGSADDVIQRLLEGSAIESATQISKMVRNKPTSWPLCVTLARLKFEKYFNHRAKNLLHAFPLDTRLKDGSSFWQSPKRPPVPLNFNPNVDSHYNFAVSTARLFAEICNIDVTPADLSKQNMLQLLAAVTVPPFVPSSKRIETDEAAKKETTEDAGTGDDYKDAGLLMQKHLNQTPIFSDMTALSFEKDDDSNAHIDFISSASNLRAEMYSIENTDRLKIKRIAGRIVPAIATTTAAVAGLVTIELVKIVKGVKLQDYKNCFMNLALPVMLLSEPGPAERTIVKEGLSYTNWDKWDVTGNKDFTLKQFLDHFKKKYGFNTTMVVHGVKMIYVPIMPAHKKRIPHTMIKLIKPHAGVKYVDLVVSFEGDGDEDIPGPPIRYHFGV
ncbi:unnamed protein product [Owenia fusiformis]|uniref:E1 ubiquitin-activating enzyme n=1 Tax=Owenia fusiformis TaxID=6347 RepID=A0A8J1TXA5_OWEFU|nr:unnamed protein product [Owenia fusiformis]